jgi:threonine/homoserine/homoserine lactone efflux protein
MPPIDNVLAVLLAGFFLSATPGPSMLYVLSRTVGQNRTAGLASALGLALGGMVLAVATALGLAKLFEEMPSIVVGLRYVGSAYLIWLGATMILNARSEAKTVLIVKEVRTRSLGSIIWQGVLVEFLNPKTVLFFALFLPPFVDTGLGVSSEVDTRVQLLTLGVLVPLTAIPVDIGVAFMGGALVQKINRQERTRERMAWFGGLILIAISVNLHLGMI